ncbi:hypothetical protein [Bradyrhizobium sp. BR13661]|uniref:hypothetical protein n=1 Tax=Bradyrhizobium sp. BR13661 TaxID=2940622 RepID=UPI00247651F3|nr:hypothetical protein [Bradyrhizobium sp. BR13661]MDH6259604.1 hypothetical protein [Bradyrhizobium sp. BR13661]
MIRITIHHRLALEAREYRVVFRWNPGFGVRRSISSLSANPYGQEIFANCIPNIGFARSEAWLVVGNNTNPLIIAISVGMKKPATDFSARV